MGTHSSYKCFLPLLLLHLLLQMLAADAILSFSVENFGEGLNFTSQLDFYGDAKVASDGMSVQMSGSGVSSAGRIILKKPINLMEGYLRKVSFSIHFVFSMSRENGDGLAFIMVPVGFPLNVFDGGSMGMFKKSKAPFLAIEFDTFMDAKYGDVNDNHIGFDVDCLVSSKVSNVSVVNMELNSGELFQAWIDYEASSKRFEVRLSKLGGIRPLEPVLVHPIDLSKMWKEEEVILGFTSSSGNSTQVCNLYSISFKSRTVPFWMHSEPVDPENFVGKGEELRVPKRSDCALKIVGALISGIVFGTLVALVVLCVRRTGSRKKGLVVPEEYAVPRTGSEYKKFNIDGMK